jgi:hypothetical protein
LKSYLNRTSIKAIDMEKFGIDRGRLSGAPHVARGFMLPLAFIDDVAQQPVGGPGQVSDLGDQLRPHPMHARKHELRAEVLKVASGIGEAEE